MKLFKMELKRAFTSKLFYLSMFIALLLMAHSIFYNYINFKYILSLMDLSKIKYRNDLADFTLYNNWLGADTISFGGNSYFFIYPILIALPYGYTLAYDCKTGLKNQLIAFCKRRTYYFTKLIVGFIVGGVIFSLPQLLSLIIGAFFFPAVTPDYTSVTIFAVFPKNIFSSLFYTKPLLYCITFILISFVFAGLLSLMSFAIIRLTNNFFVPVFIPFIVVMVTEYIGNRLIYIVRSNLSFFYIFRPKAVPEITKPWVFPLYLVIFIVIIYFSVVFKIKTRDEL